MSRVTDEMVKAFRSVVYDPKRETRWQYEVRALEAALDATEDNR